MKIRARPRGIKDTIKGQHNCFVKAGGNEWNIQQKLLFTDYLILSYSANTYLQINLHQFYTRGQYKRLPQVTRIQNVMCKYYSRGIFPLCKATSISSPPVLTTIMYVQRYFMNVSAFTWIDMYKHLIYI